LEFLIAALKHINEVALMNQGVSNAKSTPFFDYDIIKDVLKVIDIVATEAYATLRHVLPASLLWVWRKYITQEIKTIPIVATFQKVSKLAYLNIHGNCDQIESGKDFSPVMFSHGDYGHPFSVLPLIDLAQRQTGPIFSLYIPGVENAEQFYLQGNLVREAIVKIENRLL